LVSEEKKTVKLRYKGFTYKIPHALNSRGHVSGNFCDPAKAFYCVNHGILITKLAYYGLERCDGKLFTLCVSNRRQRVAIEGSDTHNNVMWSSSIHSMSILN
jgi:hypothetical protein